MGRALRRCHERGIVMLDAAGRNAIWNGREIILIDFEHTYLKKGAKPLADHERSCSYGLIMDELEGKRDFALIRAFEQGYGSR